MDAAPCVAWRVRRLVGVAVAWWWMME